MRPPHHPWHDISPGEESPKIVNAIIEIPRDSQQKYELDKETGILKLDRFLYSAVYILEIMGLFLRHCGKTVTPWT